MRVAFRVDAGLAIGSGHVMRCLTLADALAKRGAACLFLIRPHLEHLADEILVRGHRVMHLTLPDQPDYGSHPEPPAHADWLGGDWFLDAVQTREFLEVFQPDWLIIDHYALDKTWENLALSPNTQLFVIDDIADRTHQADLLLDQNFGRDAVDYDGLVPKHCERLIGPRYALLRPEFKQARPSALARRTGAAPQHLLITLGGVDKDNVTTKVLDALAQIDLPRTFHITVVMGAMSPWRAAVTERATTMPRATRVLSGVSNMATLMTKADICIGAVGGSNRERFCLGLPTLSVAIAENQDGLIKLLAAAELVWALDRNASLADWQKQIAISLSHTFAPKLRANAAKISQIVDGRGASRILQRLFERADGPRELA